MGESKVGSSGHRPVRLQLPWPTEDHLRPALQEAPVWVRGGEKRYRGYAMEQVRKAAWGWKPSEDDAFRVRMRFTPPRRGDRVNQVRVLLSVLRAMREGGLLVSARQVVEWKMWYGVRSGGPGGISVAIELLRRGDGFARPYTP